MKTQKSPSLSTGAPSMIIDLFAERLVVRRIVFGMIRCRYAICCYSERSIARSVSVIDRYDFVVVVGNHLSSNHWLEDAVCDHAASVVFKRNSDGCRVSNSVTVCSYGCRNVC